MKFQQFCPECSCSKAGIDITAVIRKTNKESSESFADLKKIFQKSLAVNKDLEAGHIISFNDLETKKPSGYGIDAKDFKKIIGKTLKQKKSAQDFLNESDLK